MKTDETGEILGKQIRLGLLFAGGWFLLSLAAAIALWAEQAKPAAVGSLLASAALLVGYAVVLGRQRRLAETAKTAATEQRQTVLEVLHKLHLGDLVVSAHDLEDLPPQLMRAIQQATGALTAHIQRIQERSREVAVIGGEVHSTSSELASGFSQQSAAVVEITATIEELARTAAQISQNAEHQAELADLAEAEGNKGAEAVQAAVLGLNGLSERITGIADRADSLGSHSKEIYRILDLISEIAHDTHILSLNAAIEAETAGEHGRRFAVVAEEVRRLAHRARESVQSVRVHLAEFSGAIRSTVVATEEGSKDARQVQEQARSAQGAIEELRGALGATSVAAQEISLATKEQRTASDQVAVTIKEVREVIQRMADGLRNFSTTARNLNETALAIQLVIQAFRFVSPRSLKHTFQQQADQLASRASGWEGIDAELEAVLRACPYLEFCYLADAEGTLLGSAISPEWSRGGRAPEGIVVGKNYADRPWFKTVQQTRSATITPLYESMHTTEQCFSVVVPVTSPDDRPLGVLGADVNLTSWIKI
ncbi:MAG: methyl-accepting chemotaxis protein [bacterium]|nr:methyl-accepting chemotaxis protein [bacterium]